MKWTSRVVAMDERKLRAVTHCDWCV